MWNTLFLKKWKRFYHWIYDIPDFFLFKEIIWVLSISNLGFEIIFMELEDYIDLLKTTAESIFFFDEKGFNWGDIFVFEIWIAEEFFQELLLIDKGCLFYLF
jgi:hypothetical protein